MKVKMNLKLNQLNAVELEEKQMNALYGGSSQCVCGCAYELEPEGSTSMENYNANVRYGYTESGGDNFLCGEKKDYVLGLSF